MRARDGTGQRGYVSPKHVWVQLVDRTAEVPGILLDWRLAGEGRWEAFVVMAEGGGDVPTHASLEWVDEARVRPRQD